MKAYRWISAGVLPLLLLGGSAIVCAQDKEDADKPRQQEPRPEPKQDEAKPPKEVKPPRDEAKPPKQEEQSREAKPDKEHPEQKMDHARPAGKSQHIPDEQFRSHFGREHTVVIRQPVIVEGRPRFQASGYWFEIVDPWPVGWAYTDDCYVDYIDGEYFLFDVLHPGVRVALFVTF
jgi:hypothetical protein